MKEEKLSTAQRRAQRIKAQGKSFGEFDFNFPTDVRSLGEYYNISMSDDKIQELVDEYRDINIKVEQEFLEKAKLDKKDIAFLFLATALQCVRQYFLTFFSEREHHEATESNDKKKQGNIYDKFKSYENSTDKQGGYYYRELNEIILKGVPYDTIPGSGMNGQNHRYKTLGHDPILGWVIGPANIMTNTLTKYNGDSYHIRNKSMFSSAINRKIISACLDRLKNEPVAFAASIAKQAIHYNSDLNTKKSLPLPLVQTLSPEYAQKLAKYGLDMANIATIGKQATYAVMINTIIAIIHRMFYDPEQGVDEKLYEVKTRKILMYSNTIATTSNILYVAFTRDIKKLDIGGAIITLYRIVTDEKFIRQVMYEFVDSKVSEVYEQQLAQVNVEYKKLIAEFGYTT